MIKIVDEQENYLLVTDGKRYAVIERRAGRFYSLHDGARRPHALTDADFEDIIHEEGCHGEQEGRRLLNEVAMTWRDLDERLR
jgi:hypothetical protein